MKLKSAKGVRTNGWFMLCDPKSQRVVTVLPQINPENNAIVRESLLKALPLYPNCDTFVYDRNCGFAPSHERLDEFAQIKYWPVEPWHGVKHKERCKYCTKNNASYKRKLRGVNCSICEQTYSWLRNYARTLNEMRDLRHHFMVLHYVRRHNDNLKSGRVDYLNEFSQKFQKGKGNGHYDCR